MDHLGVLLATIVIYKIALLAIGFAAQRLNRDETDLFLGGRKLGPVVAGLSYGASNASAWSILGLSGAAYATGLSVIWLIGGLFVGHAFAWYWAAPRLRVFSRQREILTIPELLAGARDGAFIIKALAAIIILLSFVVYVAAQFQAAGTTFVSTFGLPARESIIIGGLIVLIYTSLGGFWAVSITDALQGAIMAFAVVILPIAAIVDLGGPAAFWSLLAQNGAPDVLSLSGAHLGMAGAGAALGLAATGFGAVGQPHLLTRFMAARDGQVIRRARMIALVWIGGVYLGMTALGLAGHAAAAAIPDPEALFFVFAGDLLPPVIAAILVAAVLSAIMSTADSQLLVAASTVAHDFRLNRLLPGRTMLLSQLAIAAVSAAAILLAIAAPSDIFSRVLFSWSAMGAAFGPLIIFRLAGRQYSTPAAAAIILVGFLATVGFHLSGDSPGDFYERVIPFTAALGLAWALGKCPQRGLFSPSPPNTDG